MGSKGKVKKLSQKQRAYREVVKARISTSTPPVQYTRRLKTRKQKKLKVIAPVRGWKGLVDNPPKDDSQFIPYSFKEMIRLKELNGKRPRPLYRSGVGDTTGMVKKDSINRMPKQGKHESDAQYISRLHKEVEDEMAKIDFASKQKTELIQKEVVKSRKKQKALERLKVRKERKQKFAVEKKITGWEHLKGVIFRHVYLIMCILDEVKFNEVVQAPPTHLTKPKKVGGHKPVTIHALDRHLQT
ncbi:Coiled-coil domain-containing protein [Fasciola gigantica]|uniref:Coiled-coil domain-containing protein n=1 Tax=Fasciola gigantica TaxID=46835 RepID=A0A504Y641_FASGI|nr:Coiled-coil domain-containing protein [Fasciola gigantica]